MEILFILSMTCLILFMLLATYDGAYLHLWKYELFNKTESLFEHKTHTIRAVLFPLITWLLFLKTDALSFKIGLFFVFIDLITLAIDAYSEKESRDFMGGLPRWEYIIHLFSNSLHLSAILIMIAAKIKISGNSLLFSKDYLTYSSFETVQFIAENILPGAIILALLHVVLMFDFGKKYWALQRQKITCC